MSRDIDRLRDMAFFAAVAREGSFTKASLALGVPTSTLSRRITEFEADIKIKLFNRSTRRVTLTETGARYLQQIDDIVQQAKTVNDELNSEISDPAGVLRVSMSNDFATYFADAHFAEFHAAYPQISFDIFLTSTLPDLMTQRHDVSILTGDPPAASRLIARRVGLVRRHLYASKAYLAAQGTPLAPAQLEHHQCLFTSEIEAGAGWTLHSGADAVAVHPTPLLVTNSQSLIRQLLLQNMGIGQLSRTQASALLQGGQIVRVLPEWELEPIPLYVMTASRLVPARVRVFVDFLVQKFERLA